MAAQIIVSSEQSIEEASQIFLAEIRCLFGQAWTFIARRRNEIGIRSANARNEQVAEMANCLAAKMLEILSVCDLSQRWHLEVKGVL